MKTAFHIRRHQRWLAEYGSEIPDELFKLAYFAWLTLRMIDQPAFGQSLALQQVSIKDLRDFAIAKQAWESRL